MSSTGILPALVFALGSAPASSNTFTTGALFPNNAAQCRGVFHNHPLHWGQRLGRCSG